LTRRVINNFTMTPKFDQLVYEEAALADKASQAAKKAVYDEVGAATAAAAEGALQEISDADKAQIAALEDIIDKGGAGMSGVDKLQLTLDVGGLGSLSPEPVGQVVGFASDATNTAISLARGLGAVARNDKDAKKRHFANAALSSLGLIPYIGDAAAAAGKAARTAKAAKSGTGAFKAGAKAAGAQLKVGAKGGQVASKAALAGKPTGEVLKGVKQFTPATTLGGELGQTALGKTAVGKAAISQGADAAAKLQAVGKARKVGQVGVIGTAAADKVQSKTDIPVEKPANATHQNVKRPPVSLAASWKPRKLNSSYSY
jgi:hypothetical protein